MQSMSRQNASYFLTMPITTTEVSGVFFPLWKVLIKRFVREQSSICKSITRRQIRSRSGLLGDTLEWTFLAACVWRSENFPHWRLVGDGPIPRSISVGLSGLRFAYPVNQCRCLSRRRCWVRGCGPCNKTSLNWLVCAGALGWTEILD